MTDTRSDTRAVLAACRRLLRPVMRILLRHGVMYREFADLIKALYVEVASAEFGLRGRPTNVARTSLLTGLDRKEIKRLRDAARAPELAPASDQSRQSRLARVLSAWHQDPAFGAEGEPEPLPVNAAGGPSIAALVRAYGGDVPVSTVLKELVRIGAVTEQPDGRYRPIRRYYMPLQADTAALARAGSVLEDIGATVAHNLLRSPAAAARFEGRATNVMMDADAIKAFRQYVEEQGQQFLERIDEWLTAHESRDAPAGERLRLGLGLYWIEDHR
jgi:hypothetical protein